MTKQSKDSGKYVFVCLLVMILNLSNFFILTISYSKGCKKLKNCWWTLHGHFSRHLVVKCNWWPCAFKSIQSKNSSLHLFSKISNWRCPLHMLNLLPIKCLEFDLQIFKKPCQLTRVRLGYIKVDNKLKFDCVTFFTSLI